MLSAARFALFAGLVAISRCSEPGSPLVPDGGNACGAVCGSARPHCDAESGLCVECVENGNCPVEAPTCDLTSHECLACTSNDQCPAIEAPHCDDQTGACEPCSADADCARYGTTPVCDEPSGRCVGCTADTEAQRCGANACNLTTNVCTGVTRGTVPTCGACTTDSECQSGTACIARTREGAPAGSYCLLVAPSGGCGNTGPTQNLLPFSYTISARNASGGTVTVCSLAPSISCEAFLASGSWCTPSAGGAHTDACGSSAYADGLCVDSKCTYRCADRSDCVQAKACLLVPSSVVFGCQTPPEMPPNP